MSFTQYCPKCGKSIPLDHRPEEKLITCPRCKGRFKHSFPKPKSPTNPIQVIPAPAYDTTPVYQKKGYFQGFFSDYKGWKKRHGLL